jgi:hypothetical protein
MTVKEKRFKESSRKKVKEHLDKAACNPVTKTYSVLLEFQKFKITDAMTL